MPTFQVKDDPDPTEQPDDDSEPVVQETPLQAFYPVTPEMATPDRVYTAACAYRNYLAERREYAVTSATQARAERVEHSIQVLERSIGYWLSFLLDDPSDMIPASLKIIDMARAENVGAYPVPDLWKRAQQTATEARRAARNGTLHQRARIADKSLLTPTSAQPEPLTPEQTRAKQAQSLMDRLF